MGKAVLALKRVVTVRETVPLGEADDEGLRLGLILREIDDDTLGDSLALTLTETDGDSDPDGETLGLSDGEGEMEELGERL